MTHKDKDISRRSFLGGVGVALTAPHIIPATAFGRNKEVSPSNRIQVGVVGTGGQGKGLMENAIRHKNIRIVALCDVDQERLTEAKRLVDDYYGDQASAAYGDYRELLARDDIDALIVATPDHWHALVCVQAARKGLDIYCEKPLAWSLGEGKAIVKAVQENNCVFQVGSMQRSQNTFKLGCELVRNGYLGSINRILVALPDDNHAQWVDEFPAPPPELDWEMYVGPAEWTPFHPNRYHWDWRWWLSFGGGQMMDWIGHHGDIAHMAMGWDNSGPIEVEGIRWEPPKERNNLYNSMEHYEFQATYEGGITMTVANTCDMPDYFLDCGKLGTMFFGDNDAWLYVDRSGIQASDKKLLKTKFRKDDFRFRKQTNHMTDFFDCVVSREECIAPVNAGHRSASLGHLGKLACMLHSSFKWDPQNERITDNPALNSMLTRRYRADWSLDV
ncbi:MAG: Gfo/Idh/MocA family oxidoreductase [Candidatus Hydrogenedentes bacterium]|jgi:predicted dehydrogenase|nr:Gfo/Idh/MocA family oxidoreductase [Candidatus Hydrogenedentota bacterium]